ncbi:MAG: DUF4263 domain-containing protein [Oscillospiraceae bacterium]|nr:DUF4263 domain-containing protein [Oscillospiraceae bacterium]
MAGLFDRDYLALTEEEIQEKKRIDLEDAHVAGARFGRTDFYYKYPKAVRYWMSLFPNNYMDPKFLKESEEIERQCDEFEELLENESTKESDVKNFIQGKGYYHIPASIFKYYHFGHHDAYLFKEFKLGTEYIADYVLVGKSSDGFEFVFVEFENPYKNIVIGDGDFGNTIRKGINQVNDWHSFILSNYPTITEEFKKNTDVAIHTLPDEFYTLDPTRIHYVVVAGRREDYQEKTRRLKRKLKEDSDILIIHYDNLLDKSRELIGNNTY